MNERKSTGILLGFVLSVSLISVSITAALITKFYSRAQYQTLGFICASVIEEQPETAAVIPAVLKKYQNNAKPQTDENILFTLGYCESDFLQTPLRYSILFAAAGFSTGSLLLLFSFWAKHKKDVLRIKSLSDFLENVNTGKPGLLRPSGEDAFSKLQDEVYKTVTMLYQMRDSALEARKKFAENLANIAHQLKTPLTSISLSTQMITKTSPDLKYPEQIRLQLSRLAHLEESLLILSRIDAGTLSLEKKPADVFTILTLAADNLQELFLQAQVALDIQESESIEIMADLDWTMEAVMNLLKNCMEHTPPGKAVHCSYSQNPLYTEIFIQDEGMGFLQEDIPHLFERFYCGQNAVKNGVGIGLSLAKEIIESQNGTVRAGNLPGGGACFEIRFYSH